MKYCPRCKAAFGDSFTKCYNCEAALVRKVAGKTYVKSLVFVFKTTDETAAGVVRDLLIDHQIDCVLKKPNPARTFDEARDAFEILVSPDDHIQARHLIKTFHIDTTDNTS